MRALHRSRFVLGLLLALAAGAARAVTVEQIPTPRPTGWAVDLTGTLPPERLAELNQLGDQVKEKTGAELAVVVVSSTDGVDANEFATRLFNAWGISDNGLLVFAALEDHKAEIVLGKGLDGETGRRESETVMQGEMVPRFRAGNPAGAIVLGSIGCARRILHVSPINSGLETVPETAPEATSYAPSQAPEMPFVPQPEPGPDLSAQTSYQAPDYPEEPRRGLGILVFLVFTFLVLLVIGGIAVRGYSQGGGMETANTWTTSSYDDDRYDRYDRSRERREEERTTTSSSAAASLGAFSSGRSSSSTPSSDSSSSSGSSSNSGSNSGFSGGSSSGGGASGSW
jgi:uncharacterized membrane protein YgcG